MRDRLRAIGIGAGLLFIGVATGMVRAESSASRPVYFAEVQTGGSDSAAHEFIELYTSHDTAVDLTGWRVEYKSATGTAWQTKVALDGVVEPRGRYLVATPEVTDYFDQEHGLGLAAGGGNMRLMAGETEIDRLAWGNGDSPEGEAASAPAAGMSLLRRFDVEGGIIDTGDNSTDFIEHPSTPETTRPVDVGEEGGSDGADGDIGRDDAEGEGNDDESSEETEKAHDYLDVEIREVFPDPETPQADADDEFIELYNPHRQPIRLNGYVIMNGSKLQYRYTLPDVVLQPGQYRAFHSKDGAMTLANGGARAQVLDPDGRTASPLVTYGAAQPGRSWSRFNAGWKWTAKPTPGAANQLVVDNDTGEDSRQGGTRAAAAAERTQYPALRLSEIFPDPESPQTDAADEFVEIYNPNDFAVELEGYIVRSGGTLKTTFKLPAGTLQPNAYTVIFNDTASISLPNKGGQVRLEGGGGKVIDQTDPYPKAETGATWAEIDGKWQWTAKPTPGAPNEPVAVSSGDTEIGAESIQAAAAAMDERERVLGAMTAPATVGTSRLSTILVVTSLGSALLYAVYEYRYDLRNRVELVRRYVRSRQAPRQ